MSVEVTSQDGVCTEALCQIVQDLKQYQDWGYKTVDVSDVRSMIVDTCILIHCRRQDLPGSLNKFLMSMERLRSVSAQNPKLNIGVLMKYVDHLVV